jgi:curved DNA-binding protein CbpA
VNFYQILGVEVNATAAQIRAAYRQRALQLHPDVNPAPDAAERFARLQHAHATLSDVRLRREYDLMLVAAVSGSAPRAPAPPHAHYTWSNIADPRSRVARPLDDHDFEDLYAAFFAPRARRGSGSA